MITHNMEQNTAAWLRARMGIPTASQFDRILTPGTARKPPEPSKQQDDYICELIAELMLGHPFSGPSTTYMQRGTDTQDESIAAYEFEREVETERCGFVTNDEGTIGCSPDRLVGPKGLAEFKCPGVPKNHIEALIGLNGFAQKHKSQIQGQMYVAERNWVDLVSYYPGLPLVVMRVPRDEDYIAKLDVAVRDFVKLLHSTRAALEEKYGPFPEPLPDEPAPRPLGADEFVSAADVDVIVASRRAQWPCPTCGGDVGAQLNMPGSWCATCGNLGYVRPEGVEDARHNQARDLGQV